MSYNRIYNFAAGPAMLPVPVLEEMQRDLLALPGVGILLVDSILGRDFAVVQGIIIIVTVGVFTTNFLIEIAYAVVDPRVRYR